MKKTSKKSAGEKPRGTSAAPVASAAGPQRLDKLLGQEGLGTRSELKKAIHKGRAFVNGIVEKNPGRQITASDEVFFDGKMIRRDQYVYYMLNKPAGVISATEDGQMRTVLDLLREPAHDAEEPEALERTVESISVSEEPEALERTADSIPVSEEPEALEKTAAEKTNQGRKSAKKAGAEKNGTRPVKRAACAQPVLRKGLFPVGRLDKDTEGLLLITDDGQLAHRLLSPTKHVDKTYYAVVTGRVTKEEIRLFAEGLRVDDDFTAMPAVLRLAEKRESVAEKRVSGESSPSAKRGPIPKSEELPKKSPEEPLVLNEAGVTEYTQVYVTIREGKFHQIKRMFAAVGKEVLYLKRLEMGPLKLDTSLEPGQFRELTQAEIAALREQ